MKLSVWGTDEDGKGDAWGVSRDDWTVWGVVVGFLLWEPVCFLVGRFLPAENKSKEKRIKLVTVLFSDGKLFKYYLEYEVFL